MKTSRLLFLIDDLGNIDLDAGTEFEGTVAHPLTSALRAYGGWGWHQFDAETKNGNPDIEQTGYVIGLQYNTTLPTLDLAYRIRSALTYEHIVTENDNGDIDLAVRVHCLRMQPHQIDNVDHMDLQRRQVFAHDLCLLVDVMVDEAST